MKTVKPTLALSEVVLLLPATLFLGSLVGRRMGALSPAVADAAQRVVLWYAGRVWTLWILLVLLPFTAVLTGGATLIGRWSRMTDPQAQRQAAVLARDGPTAVITATTCFAAIVLTIVVLHMLAN